MEHWWNDTDWGNPKYLKNCQRLFACDRSSIYQFMIETGPAVCESAITRQVTTNIAMLHFILSQSRPYTYRSQWPSGLRQGSAADRVLGLRV